mmetsp:Transcript_61049/g.168921  ORF Transcript_61049/g.168921 Transcript_61049/m.168921 type:complete len:91 (-) Transcript_61049:270-542(-)
MGRHRRATREQALMLQASGVRRQDELRSTSIIMVDDAPVRYAFQERLSRLLRSRGGEENSSSTRSPIEETLFASRPSLKNPHRRIEMPRL